MKVPERFDLLAGLDDQEWRDSAACASVGGDWWFPEAGGRARTARRICNEVCPVRAECLAYAIAADEPWGIFGGLTRNERLQLVGRRKPTPAVPDHATEEAA